MKTCMILLSLLFSFSLRSQIVITNLSLTDTTQNIFYIGVDNVVKISGKEYKPLNQSVVITGGGATMTGLMGDHIIKVQKETDECSMWIYENRKRIFEKKFICRTIGDVIVRYGGLNDSIATVNQILANPFLFIDIPGSYYKHNYHITSFTAIFISHDLDSLRTFSVGNLLTDDQKELIKKLNSGDKIFFDQIYALSPDDRRRKLKPFIIIVK